ncbi:MAG: efflux RND transporter periplasmic adaptor subunit [Candidatus Abyssobacteria bacterium SURF_5]|uniref:Efflux RND transporter periplasmic adaptor subunit n=1 Tax=Abyssobacteria bacterium (strain SURF_5) TaxID=2093360 RepID=A0A3A4NEL7_ABYX5|nr:MAG: efflux RND transporter periplasmic adaptor subunit [Candidatus Abyssubacteria bacterium SURF_5]
MAGKRFSPENNRKKNMSPRISKIAVSPLVLGVLLSIALFDGCSEKKSVETNKEPRVTLVDASPVTVQDVQVVVRAVGSLEAIDRVKVAPEIRAIVEQILFVENQQVEQGDLLVKLDTRKLLLGVQQAEEALQTALAAKDLAQATIKRTEAEVENRRSTYGRDKELFESGIISESQYIQSKSAYDSAQAAVEEAKAAFRRAEKEAAAAATRISMAKENEADAYIRAPLSGVLGERLVSPGDLVEPGTPLVELVVLDPIEIAFSVPEKYRSRLSTGQSVIFEMPSIAGRIFSGATTYISPTTDPATRTVKLKARLPNKENLLQPGQFGTVRLVLEVHEQAIVIPEAAVVPREGETFVYVVNDTEAHLKKVVLGQHLEGMVEVLEGLEREQVVITAGQQKVADGYPVRVRRSDRQNGTK